MYLHPDKRSMTDAETFGINYLIKQFNWFLILESLTFKMCTIIHVKWAILLLLPSSGVAVDGDTWGGILWRHP